MAFLITLFFKLKKVNLTSVLEVKIVELVKRS